MKRFLFISILSLCFSTICSCACLDEIKTFYTSYMMNLLKNDSNNIALCKMSKAELENQKDGFNGYDLLINNFDFDCMWCKSLKFVQLGNDDFQISYQVGSKTYEIIVTIKKQNNRYLIDKISF